MMPAGIRGVERGPADAFLGPMDFRPLREGDGVRQCWVLG